MRRLFLDALELLDKHDVDYCLRRGLAQLTSPGRNQEIDLLVAPGDLPLLASILAMRGFAPVPSWGHAPHHFFLAYDEPSDAWVKFDVVTDLRYGNPIRALRPGIAAGCLRRRRRCGPAYILSPEDEFLTFLLHCLLHEVDLDSRSRARLAELRRQFGSSPAAISQAAALVERYLAPAVTWSLLDRAMDTGDWDSLKQCRGPLLRQLFWREPARSLWRLVSGLALRRLRPLLFALRCRGLAVALLAPDGAGKTTLARQLVREESLRAQMIYMGDNIEARTVGLPTTQWFARRVRSLNGNKRSLRGVVVRGLNFGNRLAEQWYRIGVARYHQLRGRFVIFDRYIYDSHLHNHDTRLWKRLRRRLFEAGAVTPDLVILLDAPADLLQQRKREHGLDWHKEQRAGYLGLREGLPQMIVVDAAREQQDVRRTVTSLIWNRYRSRTRKGHEASC